MVAVRVGAIELRLLEHITATGPMSVREAADSFGKEHGVGLTTVQQMMDRMRVKELLQRDRINGTWIYRSVESRESLLKGVVKDFVERTLGGSLEPFALYLADRSTVSEQTMTELRNIVGQLSSEVEKDNG
jgi:predicted transcriptional regulator